MPRAASIDTPLHAYRALSACRPHASGRDHRDRRLQELQELTKQVFGDAIGWLPWSRPGFELGLDLEASSPANPSAKGVVLESHGLFTWGNDAKACYELTLDIINKAIDWFAGETEGKTIFGGAVVESLPVAEAPCHRRPADAGNSRPYRQAGAQARPFRRSGRGAGIRQFEEPDVRWVRSAPAALTISCAPRSAR